jgi:hypothetical protein
MASPSLPPMPSAPGGDMQSLLGGAQPGQQPQASAVSEAIQGASRQLRDLIAGIEAVARQFPETAESASAAKMAVVEMLQGIVGAQRGPESNVAPPVVG